MLTLRLLLAAYVFQSLPTFSLFLKPRSISPFHFPNDCVKNLSTSLSKGAFLFKACVILDGFYSQLLPSLVLLKLLETEEAA
mmetsp:Transcript_17614/g.45999  ORF Transcript_17614/g.45999 Transcript_17614/m.45999 type:complete len:82 (-) Transcript_17614:2848-3093(-)